MTVENSELQLTREGYFRMYQIFREQTVTSRQAYDAVEDYCERNGYKSRYSSFENFKKCYWLAVKDRRV